MPGTPGETGSGRENGLGQAPRPTDERTAVTTRSDFSEEEWTEVALDIQAEVQQKRNPLEGYRPSSEGTAPSGEQVLVELRAVHAIVAAHATPQETAAFGQWLVETAQAAAVAAKEGGVMGFHAEQVSTGEQEMVDQVREAVSQA